MTTLASSDKPRSLLRHEWELFKAQIGEIRDQSINFIYALTFERAEWRGRAITLLFLVLTGFVLLRAHLLPEWADHARNIFIYIFNPAVAQTFTTNPFTEMLRFAFDGWPILLRYLPIFIFPFVIALHNAARFLADIFEKPIDLARKFIWEVALGGSSETALIREGEFIGREESLIYSIGGPGYVMVEMDSAALFENPDGTPHVIGPTVRGPARLTGFERFRQAIDLRDQHIRLDDGKDIAERSQDGIIVKAADVQIRYSVDRGSRQKNLREPHPFRSEQVIEKLIYEESRRVNRRSKELAGSSRYHARNNTLTIAGLLHAEFKKFIGQRKLTEFLASFSQPEARKVSDLKNAVEQQTQNLSPGQGIPEKIDPDEKAPRFTARPDVTELFKDQFRNLYRDKGLELVWIDVGTWKTPDVIVPERHFQAWLISNKNALEGSPRAIKNEQKKAFLEKTIKMIRNIPIERYRKISSSTIRPIRPRQITGSIVNGYREQLIEAKEFMEKELQKTTHQTEVRRNLAVLEQAIAHLDDILRSGGYHWFHF